MNNGIWYMVTHFSNFADAHSSPSSIVGEELYTHVSPNGSLDDGSDFNAFENVNLVGKGGPVYGKARKMMYALAEAHWGKKGERDEKGEEGEEGEEGDGMRVKPIKRGDAPGVPREASYEYKLRFEEWDA